MTFHKFAVGVVLGLAMIAVLGAGALVFSSRDFQYGLAQLSPATNGLVSFESLREVEAEIAQIRAETAEPRGELLAIEQEIAALSNQSASAQAAANAAAAEIVGDIAEIEARANVTPTQSAAADTSVQALSQRINGLASQSGLSAADQQSVAALHGQVQQLAARQDNVAASDADRVSLVERQRLVSSQVAESDRRIFALQQSVVPDYEHYQRIYSEAAALQTLSPFGVSKFLAQGHPALLSSLLVLLMGALGSLLYLFPAYLNRAEPVTMAEIVIRLIFGMCAALAFYVLANAAIAGFTLGAGVEQATTSALLNPFTVSLVGIVAGVMSEDIAKWIQDRSRGMFTQGGAAPRPAAQAEPAPTGGLVNNEAIS